MIVSIIAVLAGLLLLASFFRKISGLDRAISALRPFETVIGVVATVAGLLTLTSLIGLVLILAGLILAVGALAAVPNVGPDLQRVAGTLERFRTLIGSITLAVGVVSLLD